MKILFEVDTHLLSTQSIPFFCKSNTFPLYLFSNDSDQNRKKYSSSIPFSPFHCYKISMAHAGQKKCLRPLLLLRTKNQNDNPHC